MRSMGSKDRYEVFARRYAVVVRDCAKGEDFEHVHYGTHEEAQRQANRLWNLLHFFIGLNAIRAEDKVAG